MVTEPIGGCLKMREGLERAGGRDYQRTTKKFEGLIDKFIIIFKNIYLFIFWLHWVLVAAHGIFIEACGLFIASL